MDEVKNVTEGFGDEKYMAPELWNPNKINDCDL